MWRWHDCEALAGQGLKGCFFAGITTVGVKGLVECIWLQTLNRHEMFVRHLLVRASRVALEVAAVRGSSSFQAGRFDKGLCVQKDV